MSERTECVFVYLTPEEKQALTSQTQSEDKSQSEVVRAALMEYLDRDKATRVEEKIDRLEGKLDRVVAAVDSGGNTHTQSQGASETVEKTREIARRIQQNHDDPVKAVDVHKAIEDIAGGDKRTIGKYEGKLKQRKLLFEHPSSSAVWTSDKEEWAKWVDDYVDATPDAEVVDYAEQYSIETDEFDRLAREVDA